MAQHGEAASRWASIRPPLLGRGHFSGVHAIPKHVFKKPMAQIGWARPFSRRNGSQVATTESRNYHIAGDPVGKERQEGNGLA
jgi:hypothetical protein